MQYQIQVHDKNAWDEDGSFVCIDDCGHTHRTLSGAWRCYHSLTKKLSDGMYSGRWWHAEIYYLDGQTLSDDDSRTISDLDYRN